MKEKVIDIYKRFNDYSEKLFMLARVREDLDEIIRSPFALIDKNKVFNLMTNIDVVLDQYKSVFGGVEASQPTFGVDHS